MVVQPMGQRGEVLPVLLDRLVPSGAEGDTAVLGVRWRSSEVPGALEGRPEVPMRTR